MILLPEIHTMADDSNKSGAVLIWLGGIAATVIAGVLLYHFTQPPPPVTQVGLNGFVQEVASQKPVVNAIVTVDLGPKLASQPTDSQGRYAFIMDSTTPPAHVAAPQPGQQAAPPQLSPSLPSSSASRRTKPYQSSQPSSPSPATLPAP
jgi:hypothetical protein